MQTRSRSYANFLRRSSAGVTLLCLLTGASPAAEQPQALSWTTDTNHRSAALRVPPGNRPGFTLLPGVQTGITFTNQVAEKRHLQSNVLLGGAGVAAGDIDGDGWTDLFFCGLDSDCRLYRNEGNWTFRDITREAGVAFPGVDVTGAVLADFEGDGDLDLFFNTIGFGTHIFANNGKGQFKGATPPKGINRGRAGMTLALGDINADGFLDIYIANYRVRILMDMPGTKFKFGTRNGKQVVTSVNGTPTTHPALAGRFHVTEDGGVEDSGEPDVLFLNLGGTNVASQSFTGGRFRDARGIALKAAPMEWGLSAMFRDLNQDGRPDLYVCNDFSSPDRIWINQENGTLQEIAATAIRQTSMFSMGVDVADINRDGRDDLFVLDMQTRDHAHRMDTKEPRHPGLDRTRQITYRPQNMVNTLLVQREDGSYAEVAQRAGLAASEWSWTPLFLDVDLDGWEDVLISNGYEREARSLDGQKKVNKIRGGGRMTRETFFAARKAYPHYRTTNRAFRNEGNLTFKDTSQAWGFADAGMSHGMALADLDNDGDQDVVVNNLNSPAGIYRNNASAPRVAIRLKGRAPNTQGIGARVTLEGGPVPQSQEIIAGGRYLSSDQPQRTFAAGNSSDPLTLSVTWPGTRESTRLTVKPNHLYEVWQPGTQSPPSAPSTLPKANQSLFTDVSSLIAHAHVEDAFEEESLQPLLPRQLNRGGPGVSWCDLNGDHHDDLVIGSGQGGRMAAFVNNGNGSFSPLKTSALSRPVNGDQTGIVSLPGPDGNLQCLIGTASYRAKAFGEGTIQTWRLADGAKTPAALSLGATSPGPLCLADIDGDGDLDLFAGGHHLPGRYPQPATSRLFRNTRGSFEVDQRQVELNKELGLVRGAVFGHIDDDDAIDLVLAMEWGPIRVFLNRNGQFVEATRDLGLERHRGWWQGVATGDFDGDGRLDLVASNWGRNSPYELFPRDDSGWWIYHGDFDQNGVYDLVEAYHDIHLKRPVPQTALAFLSTGLPALSAHFEYNQDFAKAPLAAILGVPLNQAEALSAHWLESTVFLNRSTGFVASVLPQEAQWAPAFGVAVGDANGDGHEDIFLAQNFFSYRKGVARSDAGQGLWLWGDGRAGFEAASSSQSGITAWGEQRGCALADFNRDGRVDLVLAQNNGPTRLFRNDRATRGHVIRLQGSPDNPHAVGAVIRLARGPVLGPARQIQAGSGYWSQGSPVQVMALSPPASHVHVRWPDGTETKSELPAGPSVFSLRPDGTVTLNPKTDP